LAGLSNAKVVVWNTTTGEELHALETPTVVRSAGWSPDGRYVAAGCQDGAVQKRIARMPRLRPQRCRQSR